MRRLLLALMAAVTVICVVGFCATHEQVMAADDPNLITLTVYIVGEDQPFTVSIDPHEYIGNIKLYLQDKTTVDLNTLDLMHNNGHSNRILLETKNFYHYNIQDGQTITTQVSKNWKYDVVNGVENTKFTIARPLEANLKTVNANATFGMSPDNYSNYEAFVQAMDYCKKNPGTKLVINPGVYHFRGVPDDIALDNLENILIDGQNSEFIFDTEHCLRLTACNGVEFRNMIFDWDWDSSRIGSLVRIENVSPHNFDVHFLEMDEVPDDIPFASFLLYDAEELIPGSYGRYTGYSPWEDPKAIRNKEKIAPNIFHIEHNGNMYMFKEGDVCLLRHSVYSGRVFGTGHYSKNITYNNVKIYSFSGMGWVFSGHTNHFQIINSYLGLRPGEEDNRRISTAADGIHVVNTCGYFRIDNNDMSFNGDDIINVHDDVLIINSIDESRTEIKGWVTGGMVSPGEKLHFKNDQMDEFTDYEATVTYFKCDGTTYDTVVRLAEPLPDNILAGYYAHNATFSSANYVITNNYFHESKGRVAIMEADNGLFANNYMYRTVSEPLQVNATVTTGRWTGGYGTSNIYIQNNTFDQCNFGSRGSIIKVGINIDGYSPPVNIMKNIHIEDNNFLSCIHNSTQNAMDIKNVAANELTIRGNKLIDSGIINTNGILSPETIAANNSVSHEKHTHTFVAIDGGAKHKCTTCPAVRYHDFYVGSNRGTHKQVCSQCQAVNPGYVPPAGEEPTPEVTPTPVPPTDEEGVLGFCKRLYTCALGRDADPQGVQDWVNAIKGGADGAQAARGFFFSPEFTGKNHSNKEYVTRLYKTFMDREPDPAGLQAWVKALEDGASREQVFMGFVNSVEWANICFKYGIKSGGTAAPTVRIEPNDKILAFTERLYTTCLGRAADPSGLKAWADALANREGSGAKVAHGFFFSEELNAQKLSNEEFVTRLYRTFMDREPDAAGFAAWVAALNDGASREKVFDGFTQSPEFCSLCEKAGIQPY